MSQISESSSSSTSDESTEEELDSPGEKCVSLVYQFIVDELQIPERRRFIERGREDGHARLVDDYFSETPTYPNRIFRRHFRMQKDLFMRIVTALEGRSPFFQQQNDVTGRQSLSPLQKCMAALRQLAYGVPTDFLDEYLQMGESTAIKCLFKCCELVVELFGGRYLRRPDHNDIQRLLYMHETRHGFPGMLGSLDCMHWKWKKCPVAWKGQFIRGHGSPIIVLEAIASNDLWIWHVFFVVAGSRNDINVRNESLLFNNVLMRSAPKVNFTVNGAQYMKGYYLTDGIYPEWSTFIKAFPCPQDSKRKLFKQKQESARKDVERAFGVLQARWAIVRGPNRFWYKKRLKAIMLTCIILHNMIVEDEGEMIEDWPTDEKDELVEPVQGGTHDFQEYLRRNSALRDAQAHHQLRHDLVEHIWMHFGTNME